MDSCGVIRVEWKALQHHFCAPFPKASVAEGFCEAGEHRALHASVTL